MGFFQDLLEDFHGFFSRDSLQQMLNSLVGALSRFEGEFVMPGDSDSMVSVHFFDCSRHSGAFNLSADPLSILEHCSGSLHNMMRRG